MSPHLFVYGTLLSGAGHPMGARLLREGKLIGEATIQGRLYRVSHYPGLVEDDDVDVRVTGEIYQLNRPATSFPWLDAYEGILPGKRATREYERVERSVQLVSGGMLMAWVYLYRRPVSGHRLIPDGRWPSS